MNIFTYIPNTGQNILEGNRKQIVTTCFISWFRNYLGRKHLRNAFNYSRKWCLKPAHIDTCCSPSTMVFIGHCLYLIMRKGAGSSTTQKGLGLVWTVTVQLRRNWYNWFLVFDFWNTNHIVSRLYVFIMFPKFSENPVGVLLEKWDKWITFYTGLPTNSASWK